jgi:hypothetical protein
MSSLGNMTRIAAAVTMLACPGLVVAEEPATAAPAKAAVTPRPPLDLRAPDITQLFSPEELQRLLAKTIDADIEEVEVEGARTRVLPPATPVAWPGLLAPFWAMAHPTQAWRIFAPLPPDQAQRIGNTTPDATDPYRPAPSLP